MLSVVIATADRDFDPTEVVVPWKLLREAGVSIRFASSNGHPAQCDPLVLMGPLGEWSGNLRAKPENTSLYNQLEADPAFRNPIRYADIHPDAFDALLLPGGHAWGMRAYLENAVLQDKARQFLAADKPVGAICHGPLVLARCTDPATGRSLLEGRRVTGLPKTMELVAWAATSWKLGNYYRTYPQSVQDELRAAVGDRGSFEAGPLFPSYNRPFVVQDGNLITARWPGDAAAWAQRVLDAVQARAGDSERRMSAK